MKSSPNSIAHFLKRCGPIFVISVIALIGLEAVEAQNSCHLRELDLCAASMLVLTQSPGGLASTDQEITKQCVQLRDTSTCLRNYTRRCMTPMQRELVYMASNSSEQILNEYCTRGSALRTGYLKHATCFNKLRKKELKVCMTDLQASLELLSPGGGGGGGSSSGEGANTKRLQLACCAYRKFDSCLGTRLEKVCGKEAFNFVGSLVRRATSRLPETLCRSFRPDGQECTALLPKPGTPVKGPKSSSILSRLMSAYSGL